MTTYNATFRDGQVATRTSEASYVAASRRAGEVRWHRTFDAARRAAGSQGEVVTATTTLRRYDDGYCIVCKGEAEPGQITWRDAAGATRTGPCYGQAHTAPGG